ncbi:helix-turn-helix domain-containing protein [Globicatella sanguinis]|uniref:helix-turn-helix domain-containing protein n=1 Tax=Globicatella sanguinis TaxID=13076 RepID=UPI0025429EDB|nr:helix-turn-helix transcriptional regulator [Globicatella sanguinis]MDK7631615.1 helix-turn-helix transcriptional regulator [Globicatella sanguinis]WIK67060.1 helix-turn-helix transcriptional regulator [Globicatella sanguinis]WKT56465.1 helix-turn-helix transcriptional regulator [Globicatella sanguinis]
MNVKTLKTIRLKRGLKQEDIAKKLGVTKSAYGRWERGECNPRCDKLKKLAQILGVSIDSLIIFFN